VLSVEHEARFAAPVHRVRSVLTDPDFLADYAGRLKAVSHTASVATVGVATTTRLELVAPTAGVPGLLKRFVGATAAIVDLRTWQPVAAGRAVGTAAVDVTQAAGTARVRATLALHPDGEHCRLTLRGELRISLPVPLLAGQAERFALPLVLAALAAESAVVHEWLAAGRPRGSGEPGSGGQCPASSQVRPAPTETSSGTDMG
jgi:hypothetical protein